MTRLSPEHARKLGIEPDKISDKNNQMFVIEGRLPGLNELINKAKSGHKAYYGFKKAQKRRVADEIGVAGVEPVPALKLHIRHFEPDRRRDPDNVMSAGMKIILDALNYAGIIEDDGWRCVWGVDSRVLKDADNPRIEVEIEKRMKRDY